MILENDFQPKRVPLYLAISVLFVALSIAAVSAVVAWSGAQMLGFYDLRNKVDAPVYEVRQVERDASGVGMLFFGLLWLLAPASASYIAIKGSTATLDFQDRKWKVGFRLLILAVVLVTLWPLVPWIVTYSSVDRSIIGSRVLVYRSMDMAANALVALVLILKSTRRSQGADVPQS